MENKIVKYFSQITTLNQDEAKALAEGMVVSNLKKNTFLIKEGQTSIDTYFILEGSLRQYCVIDGEEKTTNFFTEGQWVISLNGLTQNTPSFHNLVCMEETSLVIGNEQKAQELFKKFHLVRKFTSVPKTKKELSSESCSPISFETGLDTFGMLGRFADFC